MTNLEVVQGIYAAFGEGNMKKMASLFSEDWVGTVPESVPNSGTYHGANNFIKIVEKNSCSFARFFNGANSVFRVR